MRSFQQKPRWSWCGAVAVAGLAMAATVLGNREALAKSPEQVLWNFCSKDKCSENIDTAEPNPLIQDADGNLYGTTVDGGINGRGTVFELSPNGGSWTFKLLYTFGGSREGAEGDGPVGALIMDTAGDLYGTTRGAGGTGLAGAVFELIPNAAHTKWHANGLYEFCSEDNCADGSSANGSLTYAGAASGALYDGTSPLYGTTAAGPQNTCGFFGGGVAYQLTRSGRKWDEQVLYSFCSKANNVDGAIPSGGLTMDSAGNLFGVTQGGGAAECDDYTRCGTAFELSPDGKKWKETVLYSFCAKESCADGVIPLGGVIMDGAGVLYGTTMWGGANGNEGTIYSLTQSGGKWTHKILHSFCAKTDCADGRWPVAGLTMDSAGNLFGTTQLGGANDIDHGTVFEFGKSYSVLYTFCRANNCKDGSSPETGLVLGASGQLFGTTLDGGTKGYGTVFQVAP
jgi:uncharacterized repeat protein (TIGR03803 family)